MIEAYEYYRTGRGESENGCVLFEAAHAATALGWDAFHLADQLLDQPLLVVVGDKNCTMCGLVIESFIFHNWGLWAPRSESG